MVHKAFLFTLKKGFIMSRSSGWASSSSGICLVSTSRSAYLRFNHVTSLVEYCYVILLFCILICSLRIWYLSLNKTVPFVAYFNSWLGLYAFFVSEAMWTRPYFNLPWFSQSTVSETDLSRLMGTTCRLILEAYEVNNPSTLPLILVMCFVMVFSKPFNILIKFIQLIAHLRPFRGRRILD
mgnify:CR=1 FL=1